MPAVIRIAASRTAIGLPAMDGMRIDAVADSSRHIHRDIGRGDQAGAIATAALGRRIRFDLCQCQLYFCAHVMRSRNRRLPSLFSSPEEDPPCVEGKIFRLGQWHLQGRPAFCWGLQPSLSVQHQLGQSYTASTLNIRKVALLGPASCSGLVRWRALRSGTMPAAMQTGASIALGRGGKEDCLRVTRLGG
jgi:hypothetical protein